MPIARAVDFKCGLTRSSVVHGRKLRCEFQHAIINRVHLIQDRPPRPLLVINHTRTVHYEIVESKASAM